MVACRICKWSCLKVAQRLVAKPNSPGLESDSECSAAKVPFSRQEVWHPQRGVPAVRICKMQKAFEGSA